jgi:nucleoside diphosphate kinase
LTAEQISCVAPDASDEEKSYLGSGFVTALCLEGAGAVGRWKLLCGPAYGGEGTDTIRGNFAESEIKNAVHASKDFSAAKTEIRALFPTKSTSAMERTCLLIKPEAVLTAPEITRAVERAGFTVVKSLGLQLSDVRAEEFLKNSLSELEM